MEQEMIKYPFRLSVEGVYQTLRQEEPVEWSELIHHLVKNAQGKNATVYIPVSKESFDNEVVVSDLLQEELVDAPIQVRNLLRNFDKNYFEQVILTDEAKELADKYIDENVVGKSSLDDCRHIALATINNVDILARIA